MIISKRKRFLFFHVPKVAGSSITAVLRKFGHIPSERLYNYMFDYLGPRDWLWLFPRHIKPAEARKVLPSQVFNQYYKFAFVRNPYDWHVSQYNYHRGTTNSFFHSQLKDLSFKEYVVWAAEHQEEAKSIQSSFLSDNDGTMLVDFVGKFENLEDDFQVICDRLGIRNKLPRRNSSQRRPNYMSYYDDELREIIYKSHKKDFDTFGYEH